MQAYLNKISFWILLLLPISLLFGIDFNVKVIVLFALFLFLDYRNFFIAFKNSFSNKWVLFFISLFMIQLVGLLHSSNINYTLHYFETKVSIIIFPILIYIFFNKYRIDVERFVKMYAYGVFIISSIIIGYLVLKNGGYDQSFLAKNVPNHHIYFGMYLSFAAIVFWYYLFKAKVKIVFKALYYFLPLLFSILILLAVGSRTAFIALITGVIISTVILLKSNKLKQNRQILLFLLFLFAIVMVVVFTNEEITDRLSRLFNESRKNSPLLKRMVQWECGLKIFKENFLFGVGTGDVQEYLNMCYRENKFRGYRYKLNTHNQYLDEGIKNGILGLLTILSLYFYMLYYSIKCKKHVYSYFLITIIIVSFAENILSRQAGVVFYSFFNSLLFFGYRLNEEFNEKSLNT